MYESERTTGFVEPELDRITQSSQSRMAEQRLDGMMERFQGEWERILKAPHVICADVNKIPTVGGTEILYLTKKDDL